MSQPLKFYPSNFPLTNAIKVEHYLDILVTASVCMVQISAISAL